MKKLIRMALLFMKDRIIVEKIINYIDKILDYTKDYNYEQFVDNLICL